MEVGSSKSLYDALELQPDASDAEIKRSYRRLALQFHPDKNPNGGDRFKQISYAWEILSDERMKAIYDRHGDMGIEMAQHLGDMNILLTSEGESMILCGLFLCSVATALLGIFPIFIALRADDAVSWSWAVVFTPMWIVDAFMFLFVVMRYFMWSPPSSSGRSGSSSQDNSGDGDADGDNDDDKDSIGTQSKSKERKVDLVLGGARLVQFALFLAFQILLVLKLDASISWSFAAVFIPWFLLEGTVFIRLIMEFIVVVALLSSPDVTSSRSTLASPSTARIFMAFYEIFKHWVVRVVLVLLICLRADLVFMHSWFIVFIPVYIAMALQVLTPICAFKLADRTSEDSAPKKSMLIARTIFNVIFATLVLTTVCLFAARLDGGTTEIVYSMATILIPVFLVLSMVFCCFCCCLPCSVLMGGIQPAAHDPERANPLANLHRRIEMS